MKIGFLKLGLKTYFNTKKDSFQGSNHELISIFNIFKERGHDCYMLSNHDLVDYKVNPEDIKTFDYFFVFNGPSPTKIDSPLVIHQWPIRMIKIINEHKHIPWLYFWTDVRYKPDTLPITNKNRMILSQTHDDYGHLDKIVLYGKKIRERRFKEFRFKILMNNTGGKRWKNALAIAKSISDESDIIGDFKDEIHNVAVNFDVLPELLDEIKFSWNQTKHPDWVSQKFWEMILSNVICFHYNSDMKKLVIPGFLRDQGGFPETMEQLEHDENLYESWIKIQQRLVKPEYLNGDFLYNLIKGRLKQGVIT